MNEWENLTINCDINDTLNHMNEAEYGAHYIIIYPNLDTIRQIYSSYIHKQIQENNEIVLVNPFYETTDSIRQLLFQDNPDLDVSKLEKEKSLIIIDSLQEYFGKRPDMPFKTNLANHAKKIGKNGVSILGDIGAYPYKSKSEDLVDYESSLPAKYDLPVKGFCLYHQQDFDRFSDEQKQKLIGYHGKTLNIIEKKTVDSTFFKQPLNFVHHVKECRHIVLFYEEIEYATVISFEFIKSGLEDKKMCTYLSDEDVETVKRELVDNGIDVNKFSMDGLLHIYQFPCKDDNHTRNTHINENRLENIYTPGQGHRIVFKCHYEINTQEQIKSNLKWEREYRLKKLKNRTLLCTYPVENIISKLSDSTGAHAKWMSDLLTMYDGVIFARKFWKGIAFNLD